VARAPVAAQIDKALDVQADLTTEIAFHLHAAIDELTDFLNFRFIERVGFLVEVDARLSQNFPRRRTADAEHVRQRDFNSLSTREIDSCNTSHS